MKQGRRLFDDILTRYGTWLLLAVVLGMGLLLRWLLFPFVSEDMQAFLIDWMERVREMGGFTALGTQIGDYTPAYMLLIAATSYLRFDAIVIVKAISVGADIGLAASAYLLVWQLTGKQKRAAFAAAFVFLLPTVVMNSSMWGQCDALFTSFLLLFLFFYFRGNPYIAMLCYWAALAFKLQAIFLAPLVVLLLAAHRLKLRHVLVGFTSYFLLFLPGILMGRGITVLWNVYLMQSRQYEYALTLNTPNLYAWLEIRTRELVEYSNVAVLFGLCIVGICFFALWLRRASLDNTAILYAALFFAFLVPHVMPRMHERYFFIADILALVIACCFLQRLPFAIVTQCISIMVYLPFLLQTSVIDLHKLTIISLLLLCWIGYVLYRHVGVCFGNSIRENMPRQNEQLGAGAEE